MKIRGSHHQEDTPRSSCGSAASGSQMVKVEPTEENVRLTDADDDARSGAPVVGKKKKECRRVVGENRGLRHFSMKICQKLESKGRTTYNEVADELVAEHAVPSNSRTSQDQHQDDEKNIRRRVYDALNVLLAMDIISKEKKEIQWKGLPPTRLDDIEELKAEHVGLMKRVKKKAEYLQELEEQYTGLGNLIERNEQLYGSKYASIGSIAVPFILVQTRPHATVEVEISEDMQLVHLDFMSTPFELYDDVYILKAMRLCERRQAEDGVKDLRPNGGARSSVVDIYQRLKGAGRATTSPPLPGILKPSRKHGQ